MDGGFNYDTQGSIEYCNFIGRGNLVGGGGRDLHDFGIKSICRITTLMCLKDT